MTDERKDHGDHGVFRHTETCPRCAGKGSIPNSVSGWPEACPRCTGSGLVAIYLHDGEAVMRPVKVAGS